MQLSSLLYPSPIYLNAVPLQGTEKKKTGSSSHQRKRRKKGRGKVHLVTQVKNRLKKEKAPIEVMFEQFLDKIAQLKDASSSEVCRAWLSYIYCLLIGHGCVIWFWHHSGC